MTFYRRPHHRRSAHSEQTTGESFEEYLGNSNLHSFFGRRSYCAAELQHGHGAAGTGASGAGAPCSIAATGRTTAGCRQQVTTEPAGRNAATTNCATGNGHVADRTAGSIQCHAS